jgi:hypothetical protein
MIGLKITLKPEALEDVMEILVAQDVCDYCGKTQAEANEEVVAASCGDGMISIHRGCVRIDRESDKMRDAV